MQRVRIRERNQIMLPDNIAAATNLRVNDVLEVGLVNGVITLVPQTKQASRLSMRDLTGIAAGAFGKTRQEIDASIASERCVARSGLQKDQIDLRGLERIRSPKRLVA